jgi:hypothetical protein
MGRWKNMNTHSNRDKLEKSMSRLASNIKAVNANKCKECDNNDKGFCTAYGKWCYIVNNKCSH